MFKVSVLGSVVSLPPFVLKPFKDEIFIYVIKSGAIVASVVVVAPSIVLSEGSPLLGLKLLTTTGLLSWAVG